MGCWPLQVPHAQGSRLACNYLTTHTNVKLRLFSSRPIKKFGNRNPHFLKDLGMESSEPWIICTQSSNLFHWSSCNRPEFGLDNSGRIFVGLLHSEMRVGPLPLRTEAGRVCIISMQAVVVFLLPSRKYAPSIGEWPNEVKY
jgi:hypothetical protein